ncbi:MULTISPECIES: hypothetical protein [unclassified Nocardioides]|uniref:hypothetical protein n=1 Tax=unclassified Nocardioides TaxID=2615069 RepID=UPI0009EF83E7|nr:MULTISPECIES: hypothetical protein [unclassified Nocardioides]GAW51318.1 uncharacterized protein PD653B2_3660 [Nocardioides sp. PD653-B2]GAW52665.1 uncharacterized protein PD653_0058 [Nocardioides sp. PD653]
MSTGGEPDQRGPVLFLVFLLLAGFLLIAWGLGRDEANGEPVPPSVERGGAPPPTEVETPADDASAPAPTTRPTDPRPATLPDGGTRVFGGHHVLVAYYGTAQTGAMGVLGETDPDTMDARLHRAAAPFRRPGQPVRHVYELIVTIADASAGPDGDYSHDIPRAEVERYVRAAHRNHALLLLDIQPGRSPFPDVVKRWAWALRDPWVGLALDPEWRMGPHQVPAHTVGQVSAREVNRTSWWLARLTRAQGLPEKLFVLHQFRTDMVARIAQVKSRPGLAMVQHVDGFGTPRQKLATYHAVARPRQFTMGFKLFYDEDVHRMGAPQVRAVRPTVRFVSFQ